MLHAMNDLKRATIFLMFYQPGDDDPLQNRLVAMVDRPFCHVEIAFPERECTEPWDRVMWGSSIYQGEGVFFKKKTYQRDGYVSVAIEVSTAQMLKIKSYCQAQEHTSAFSRSAMYAAYVPFQLVYTEDTFCSKHVANALLHGDVIEVLGVNPSLTTPSNLYRLMTSQGSSILKVVPGRMAPANHRCCSANMAKAMMSKELLGA